MGLSGPGRPAGTLGERMSTPGTPDDLLALAARCARRAMTGDGAWNPDRHCAGQAAPPGSSLHYATLYAGTRERGAIVAVHALRHALVDVVDTIADANVRAAKLNWWSGEILHARERPPAPPGFGGGCPALRKVALAPPGGARHALGGRPGVGRGRIRVRGGTGRVLRACRRRARRGLCMAATAAGGYAPHDIGAIGVALERAILAGTPSVRSGLRRVPISAPAPGRKRRTR